MVEGLGVDGLATGSSSASSCLGISGSAMDDQLLFQEQVLGNECSAAAGSTEFGEGNQ